MNKILDVKEINGDAVIIEQDDECDGFVARLRDSHLHATGKTQYVALARLQRCMRQMAEEILMLIPLDERVDFMFREGDYKDEL